MLPISLLKDNRWETAVIRRGKHFTWRVLGRKMWIDHIKSSQDPVRILPSPKLFIL